MLSQRVAEAFDAWFARLAAARGVRLVVVGRADVLRLTVSKRHARGRVRRLDGSVRGRARSAARAGERIPARDAPDRPTPPRPLARRAAPRRAAPRPGPARVTPLLRAQETPRGPSRAPPPCGRARRRVAAPGLRGPRRRRRGRAVPATRGLPARRRLRRRRPEAAPARRRVVAEHFFFFFYGRRVRRRNRAHAGHPSTYVANWPAVADTLRGSPFAVLVADANDPVAAGPVVASLPPASGPPAPAPVPPAAAGFLFFFASGVLVGVGMARGRR